MCECVCCVCVCVCLMIVLSCTLQLFAVFLNILMLFRRHEIISAVRTYECACCSRLCVC